MNYRVLIIEAEFAIPDSRSLKDKRQLRLRLFDRLKAHYNVSVAETGSQDKWQTLEFTIAYVALTQGSAEEMRETLEEACLNLSEGRGELRRFDAEIV